MKFDKKIMIILVLAIVAIILLVRRTSGYSKNDTTDSTKCICPSSDQARNPWVLDISMPKAPICRRRPCPTCPMKNGAPPATRASPKYCPCNAGYTYNPNFWLGSMTGRNNFICK